MCFSEDSKDSFGEISYSFTKNKDFSPAKAGFEMTEDANSPEGLSSSTQVIPFQSTKYRMSAVEIIFVYRCPFDAQYYVL